MGNKLNTNSPPGNPLAQVITGPTTKPTVDLTSASIGAMGPLDIVEVDRRPPEVRAESNFARDQRDRLARQLRSALQQKQRAWDQGFAAAVDMVARGATLGRLRECIRKPGEVPQLARGTRETIPPVGERLGDTQPIDLVEADDWGSTPVDDTPTRPNRTSPR